MSTHEGGCLCGLVRYRVQGPFHQFHLCHCSRCRHFSGTAHAANLMVPASHLEWLGGEDSVRRYDLPETRFSRAFCEACGAMVPHTRGELAIVPAGGLDRDPDMDPDDHIFWDDRAGWYEPGLGARKYSQTPNG